MNTKLTLRMDDSLIESAKHYSLQSGKSVSQIVADYFTIIRNEQLGESHHITPTVRTLKGVLSNTDVKEVDYYKHLEQKHL